MNGSIVADVVVIGGGPAGLNAALVLGRARRSVALVDEELPRNRVTRHSHGFLTRDGITPGEFRRIARDEVTAYPTVQVLKDRVINLTGQNGAFITETALGTTIASRKVLFATGMKEDLPAVPGLAEAYGQSAFVCPYCDGWELRDQPLALIAQGDKAFHMAKVLRGWTDDVRLCTNGPAELSATQRTELSQHGIPLHESPIARIESAGGRVQAIRLQDGAEVRCTGIFFAPLLVPATRLPAALGCEMTPAGAVRVGATCDTTVPGVYVAGDAARERHQLIMAAADGSLAAIAINTELLEEDWMNKG